MGSGWGVFINDKTDGAEQRRKKLKNTYYT